MDKSWIGLLPLIIVLFNTMDRIKLIGLWKVGIQMPDRHSTGNRVLHWILRICM